VSESTEIVKRGPGRPRKTLDTIKVTDDMIEAMAYEFAATHEQIAHILGIADNTLRRLLKEDPTLAESYNRGKSRLQRKLTRAFINRALAKGAPPALLIFLMKNICNWTDSPKVVQHTGPDGGPVEFVVRYGGPASQIEAAADDVVEAEAEEVEGDDDE